MRFIHHNLGAGRPGKGYRARYALARDCAFRPMAVLANEVGHRLDHDRAGYRFYGGWQTGVFVRRGIKVLAHDEWELSAAVPGNPGWGHRRVAQAVTIRTRKGPVTLISAHLTPARSGDGSRANFDGLARLWRVEAEYRARGHQTVVGMDSNRHIEALTPTRVPGVLTFHFSGLDWLAWSPGLRKVRVRYLGNLGSDHPARLIRLRWA